MKNLCATQIMMDDDSILSVPEKEAHLLCYLCSGFLFVAKKNLLIDINGQIVSYCVFEISHQVQLWTGVASTDQF